MSSKAADDHIIEERIRAHVRQRMTQLGLGVTAAARRSGCSQGNLSKILQQQRGLGLGMAVRLISGLGLDALRTLTLDPPPEFFRPYVPRSSDEPPSHPRKRGTRP